MQPHQAGECLGVRGVAARIAYLTIAGWFPLSSCQGHHPDWHIYNCIAEIYYNYFNFAEGKTRTERAQAEESEWMCEEEEYGGSEKQK